MFFNREKTKIESTPKTEEEYSSNVIDVSIPFHAFLPVK